MQDDFVRLMRQLAPELAGEIARRALVLERIAAMAPVGRRQLAAKLELPEREVRSDAAALKDAGLIDLNASGMMLTAKGQELLPGVQAFSRAMHGLTDLESRLAAAYGIGHVHVAAGDADGDESILQDVGRMAANRVRATLQNGSTLAVTGGSTMAATAKYMQSANPLNVMVVPARGGMGRSVAYQANTLAAEIAQRLGGHHRLIHLPDRMDAAAMQEMLKVPEVREAMDRLQRADVILHGIGRADESAQERKLSVPQMRKLEEGGAVAEALGYYFNGKGDVLLAFSSVGVDLNRLKPSCQMIAVAAGKRKAQAIAAIVKRYPHAALITDEGAAKAMLALAEQN
ncbi:MAG: hypothetical protein J6M20_07900 [Clostridia bacterium]|nr:hypothetical protein [Clostridia bacterium]